MFGILLASLLYISRTLYPLACYQSEHCISTAIPPIRTFSTSQLPHAYDPLISSTYHFPELKTAPTVRLWASITLIQGHSLKYGNVLAEACGFGILASSMMDRQL